MGNPVTGSELSETVEIGLLRDLVNDWRLPLVGRSGTACGCPVALLLSRRHACSMSVDYDEAHFEGLNRRPLKLSEAVTKLILKIDTEFEGRSVPTTWFKAEVERIAG